MKRDLGVYRASADEHIPASANTNLPSQFSHDKIESFAIVENLSDILVV